MLLYPLGYLTGQPYPEPLMRGEWFFLLVSFPLELLAVWLLWWYRDLFQYVPVASSTPLSLSGKIVGGIASALAGLLIYLWASRHSPYNPLGAIVAGGLDSYVLKEPFYTVILLIAVGLGLLGISLLVLGLIDRARLP